MTQRFRKPDAKERPRLNPFHRLNRGMVGCILYNADISPLNLNGYSYSQMVYDLVNPGLNITHRGSFESTRAANEGLAFRNTGAQGTHVLAGSQYVGDSEPMSVVIRFIDEDIATTRGLFCRGDDTAGGWSFAVARRTNNPTYGFSIVTTTPGTAQSNSYATATLPKGIVHTLVCVWNPGVELRIYYDGIDGGGVATTRTNLRSSTYGCRIPGTNLGFGVYGQYLMTNVYNRVLSASEAKELHFFPYGTNSTPRFLTAESIASRFYFGVTGTQYSYSGDISAYPSLQASSTYRHGASYSGSIDAYPGLSATTNRINNNRYAGTIPAYPGVSASSYGKHQWFASGEIPAHPRIGSHTYNYIGIPDSTPGNPGKIDITTALDVVDLGMQATGGGIGGPGLEADDFTRGMFIVNTNDYDGTVSYFLQIIAKNIGLTDETVQLFRLYDWVYDEPITYSTEVSAEITVPAGTNEWTLFQIPWTPTAGEQRYFWKVPYVGGPYSYVMVATGRPVIRQTGATKTLIWRPMANGTEGVMAHANVGIAWSSPRLWGYYGPEDWQTVGGTWYWDASLYGFSTAAIVLEACALSSYQKAKTEFRLYDLTSDMAVPGTSFFVDHGGAFNGPNGYVQRKEFSPGLLTTGHLYTSQFRLYSVDGGITSWILTSCGYGRAMFGIRMNGIVKTEVLWRVAKAMGNPVAAYYGSSRVRIDLSGGNSELVYAKNESCSVADFDFRVDPEFDFWITDDGHLTSGDGSGGSTITDSNAHQDPVAELLPIFSGNWAGSLTSGNYLTQWAIPANTGGDANAKWTLIALGLRPITPPTGPPICYYETPTCEPVLAYACNDPGYQEQCGWEPAMAEACQDPAFAEICDWVPEFTDINQ